MNSFFLIFVIMLFALSRGIQRIFTALALEHLEPWSVAGLSLLIATIFWIPFALWKNWLIWDLRLWLRCAPLGVVNIAIPGVSFIAAQQFVSASAAALLVASMPILIAVLAALFLGERPQRNAVLGIGIGTLGVVILTIGKGGVISGKSWTTGLILISIGVLSASFVYVGWRKLLSEYRGVEILAPQLVISTIITLPIALATGLGSHLLPQLPLLAALGVVNYIIPQIAMFWLITKTTAVRAALPNYLAPLFATFLAIPILQQSVTYLVIAGGFLIISGAVLINTKRQQTTMNEGND